MSLLGLHLGYGLAKISGRVVRLKKLDPDPGEPAGGRHDRVPGFMNGGSVSFRLDHVSRHLS